MPVLVAAHSGVYSTTAAASCSKPSVYCLTKSWSYSFSAIITWSIARAKARSVPGRGCSQVVAAVEVGVRLGSR